MMTPVFQPKAPGALPPNASSCCSKLKTTPICVFPMEADGKTVQPVCKPALKEKPKPLSAKPVVASFASKFQTVNVSSSRQPPPCPPLGDKLSIAKELRSRLTPAPTCKADDKAVHMAKRTELSLSDIASSDSTTLPLTVQVVSSCDSKLPLSKGEVLNILAVKSMTVVSATSGCHNFSIPLNSSVPFSVVYNPDSNVKKALEGRLFPNARALMKAKVLPRVVYVTEPRSALRAVDAKVKASAPISSDSCTSHTNVIEKDEILVFDQTETDRESQKYKVFSIKAKTNKLLTDDCKLSFSTCPEHVSMFMTDIVQYIADQFPCKVAMTGSNTISNIDPNDITLLKVVTERSLLCASGRYVSTLIDIPVNSSGVKVAIDDSNSSKRSCTYAADIMQRYISEKLTYIRESSIQEAQTFFYSQVRPGFEMTGVKISTPLPSCELAKNLAKQTTCGPQVIIVHVQQIM